MRSEENREFPRKAQLAQPWELRLYVAGMTPASVSAIRNANLLRDEHLPAGSTLQVIDLLIDPESARRDQVVGIPTLVRVQPTPVRRIIGNLNDFPKTLQILGFSNATAAPSGKP